MNKKDFTQKDFENHIATRPSAKESDGAWEDYKKFVKHNELAEKETPKETWDRLEKEQKHPTEKYYEDRNKKAAARPKVLNYIDKTIDMYEGGEDKAPPIMERRGQQTLALRQIGKKVLDEGNLKPEDVELKLDSNGLHTNKDRTIAVRDSFVANAFNRSLGIKPNYPTQATPKQFGELAERLEKDRQMRGAPTNVQQFKKNFNNINSQKPFIKKPIKRTGPIEPVKINLNNYKPFIPPPPIEKSPEIIQAERRFQELRNEIDRENFKKANSGLAGLMGGDPKYGK